MSAQPRDSRGRFKANGRANGRKAREAGLNELRIAQEMSTLLSRSMLARRAGQHFDGDRDLYRTMGYIRTLTAEDYLGQYLRGDLAARIVDAYPDATWREPPTVKREGTNEGDDDDFSKAIEALDEKFGFWSVLSRLDRLAGLGHYGVLLIGLDGGVPLDQPVEGGGFRLLYFNPVGEVHAQILEWEKNERSPRYGKPLRY